MRLWIRRIIFYFFALSFTISAIGVLLYANGYRFNVVSGWFEKTGVIYASSDPSGAMLSLGTATTGSFWERSISPGKPFKTPARITYVLPGVYHAVLSKDAFFDFSRDLEVKVGQTAFFNDIILLKKTALSHLADVLQVDALVSLNKTSYIVSTPKGLSVFNTKNNTLGVVDAAKKAITDVTVSPDGAFIIVQSDGAWYRFNARQLSERGTKLDIPAGDHVFFDGHSVLYACGSTGIAMYQNVTKKIVVSQTGVLDCMFSGSDLYTLSADGNQTAVSVVTLGKTPSDVRELAHLPVTGATFGELSFPYLFIKGVNGSSFVYDTHDAVPHIIDLERMTHAVLYDDNTIIANNDIEINRFYVNNNTVSKTLITRESDGISEVTIEQGIPYVFFVSGGHEVIALENSDSPTPNRYSLATLDDVDAIRMVSDKKTLLIAGRSEEKSGFFALQVLP